MKKSTYKKGYSKKKRKTPKKVSVTVNKKGKTKRRAIPTEGLFKHTTKGTRIMSFFDKSYYQGDYLSASDIHYDWFAGNPIKVLVKGEVRTRSFGDVGWEGGSPKNTPWNEVTLDDPSIAYFVYNKEEPAETASLYYLLVLREEALTHQEFKKMMVKERSNGESTFYPLSEEEFKKVVDLAWKIPLEEVNEELGTDFEED